MRQKATKTSCPAANDEEGGALPTATWLKADSTSIRPATSMHDAVVFTRPSLLIPYVATSRPGTSATVASMRAHKDSVSRSRILAARTCRSGIAKAVTFAGESAASEALA